MSELRDSRFPFAAGVLSAGAADGAGVGRDTGVAPGGIWTPRLLAPWRSPFRAASRSPPPLIHRSKSERKRSAVAGFFAATAARILSASSCSEDIRGIL